MGSSRPPERQGAQRPADPHPRRPHCRARALADDRGARKGRRRRGGAGDRGPRVRQRVLRPQPFGAARRRFAGRARRSCSARRSEATKASRTARCVDAGLDALDERERRIIELRFFEGLTQSQIAAEIGISQMHVSRLLRRALQTMRGRIEDAGGSGSEPPERPQAPAALPAPVPSSSRFPAYSRYLVLARLSLAGIAPVARPRRGHAGRSQARGHGSVLRTSSVMHTRMTPAATCACRICLDPGAAHRRGRRRRSGSDAARPSQAGIRPRCARRAWVLIMRAVVDELEIESPPPAAPSCASARPCPPEPVVAPGNTVTLRAAANTSQGVVLGRVHTFWYERSLRPSPARFSPANHTRTSRRDH